jgi:phage terminase small subunit
MCASSCLTPKQARFVQEYLVDGNGSGAAVRAGYGAAGAKVTACRLLTNTNVSKALKKRQEADAARLAVAREDVLAGLLEAVDLAREQRNPMGMVSGWRELAKMLGYYAPEVKRVELTADQDGTYRAMQGMTDAQLMAVIARGAGPG